MKIEMRIYPTKLSIETNNWNKLLQHSLNAVLFFLSGDWLSLVPVNVMVLVQMETF